MAINSVPPTDILIASAAAQGSHLGGDERILAALVAGRSSRAFLLADLGNGRMIRLETPQQFEQGTQLRLAVSNAASTARILTATAPEGQRLPVQATQLLRFDYQRAAKPAAPAPPAANGAQNVAPSSLPTSAPAVSGSLLANRPQLATPQVSVQPTSTAQSPPAATAPPARSLNAPLSYQIQAQAGEQAASPTRSSPQGAAPTQGGAGPPPRPASSAAGAPKLAPPPAAQTTPKAQPVVRDMVRNALQNQASAAPLFALAQTVSQSAGPPLPAAAMDLVSQVLGLRRPVAEMADPVLLKQAIRLSGPFHEAGLLAQSGARSDLKALLMQLELLMSPRQRADGVARPTARPAPPSRGMLPRPMPALAAPQPGFPGASSQLAQLAELATAALSRVRLFQFAGLPGTPAEDGDPAPLSGQQWVGELPVLINGKTALVYFELDRQTDPETEPEERDTWTLSFSLDCDPDGPVYAKVSLQARSVSVRLWAEEEATAARFLTQITQLKAEVDDLGLNTVEVAVHIGMPSNTSNSTRSAEPGR